MQRRQDWQTRYDELHTVLTFAGAVFADKHAETGDHTLASQLFVQVWPQFCQHVKTMPADQTLAAAGRAH